MRWISPVTLALALCLASCSGKKETPSGGGEKQSAQPSAEAATAASPASKRVETTDFRFGRALGADGMVTGEGGPFTQGETLHVSFKVNRASAGSACKVTVTGVADKKTYFEEQKNPSGPTSVMAFSLPDTRSWPAGDYRLEMQLTDGTDVQRGTFDFKIVSPKK